MIESPVPSRPLLRVVAPARLEAADRAEAEQRAGALKLTDNVITGLAGHIRTQFDLMKRHRDNQSAGWSHRLLAAQRAFNGQYSPEKLAEIRKFQGSEVYARLVGMKCRGASALLRDVYLAPDRPWGLDPSPDPEIPPEVSASIQQLTQAETQTMAAAGQPPDPSTIRDRVFQLIEAARQAAKKKAAKQADIAEDKIDELLINGSFYNALQEFITDLPLFPFACMKGPVVKMMPSVTWEQGMAKTSNKAQLTWTRVSPFDIFFTPGVSRIEDASMIERVRLTRADLNDLLDLPGYNTAAIRDVLENYGSGLHDVLDSTESERAVGENRENPHVNQSGMIDCLEFHGNVQGKFLRDYGMSSDVIKDELRDYFVTAWVIGRNVIKCQLSISPRKRHPYFITSFEKVPGTPVGNGLPDILEDIAEVANATLRALVNNLAIASGPQVVINQDRLAADEDGDELYPWKRWYVQNPQFQNSSSEKPVEFFNPQSIAQELLTVFNTFYGLADDLSAIPRYLAGSGAPGGAGRTASGLAMLMGNASKILQTVAANIDRDVLQPLLRSLFDMIMMTDQSGLLSGEEQIKVMGVQVAVQRETQRARWLEFLQVTANPIDMQIIGPKGRAEVLRNVANSLNLPGAQIVPSDDTLDAQQKQAAEIAQQQGVPGHSGMGEQAQAAQGDQSPTPTQDMGPRTRLAGGVH